MMNLRRPRIDPLESLRPSRLEDYVGQEHIKDLLWTAIEAAKKRNQPLDHVLLNGPPGLGKTTLANIIAEEMGWGIKTTIAPSLGSPRAAVRLLIGLPEREMIFIDEIHRLRQPVQEVLYTALEDGVVYSTLSRTDTELKFPPTTFIGATTNIGKLNQPFIDRFGLQFQLEYYSVDELSSIILSSSMKLGMDVSWDVADVIARRARGTPRIANTFLRRIRDYADIEPLNHLTVQFAEMVIRRKLHTDEVGLRPIDYRYMQFLAAQSHPVGVEVIAAAINEEVDTVQSFIEPYLMSLGFMERRSTGRWLTNPGHKFLSTAKSPR